MLMSETVRLSADLSSSHPLCKKSTEQMKKIPTIVLSVSYKGVKFIDATNKVLVYNLYLDCKSNNAAELRNRNELHAIKGH